MSGVRGSWDWHNPRLLGKQPSKGNLYWSGFLALRPFAQQIDQRQVRFQRLRGQAGNAGAVIRAVEPRARVHRAGENAAAQGSVGNQADRRFRS